MQFIKHLLPILLATMLSSCLQNNKQKHAHTNNNKPAINHIDTTSYGNYLDSILQNIPTDTSPVFGYRFAIEGDFDGNGTKEHLAEHFVSRSTAHEIAKFYNGVTDYDQLIALTIKSNARCYLSADDKNIDTLPISSQVEHFGLSFLKNEGDINGDGNDEISYVVNWADWSTLNTWYIASYQNHTWQTIYTFAIWDWQLPDIPEINNQYGLFGLENKTAQTQTNSANTETANDLKQFEGLVHKLKNNRIQIIYQNTDAEIDTMIVTLKSKPNNRK